MTTNQTVDSIFTAIIKAPIDKIDTPTWLPPIVSTFDGHSLAVRWPTLAPTIMRKFELDLPDESQRNLSRASQKTTLRQS